MIFVDNAPSYGAKRSGLVLLSLKSTREGALAPVVGEVRLSAKRKVGLPCGIERGTGGFEGCSRAAAALAPVIERIESDAPAPLVGMDRHAWARRNFAAVNVAVIDIPAAPRRAIGR